MAALAEPAELPVMRIVALVAGDADSTELDFPRHRLGVAYAAVQALVGAIKGIVGLRIVIERPA